MVLFANVAISEEKMKRKDDVSIFSPQILLEACFIHIYLLCCGLLDSCYFIAFVPLYAFCSNGDVLIMKKKNSEICMVKIYMLQE